MGSSARTHPATSASDTVVRIELTPVAGNSPSIGFDWRPVALGAGRSYTCTVRGDDGQALSVAVEQPPYRRALTGHGVVDVPAIPIAAAGTSGRITVRAEATGARAEFHWTWQPGGGASWSPRRYWRGVAATLNRIAVRKATDTRAGVEPATESTDAGTPVTTAFFGCPAEGRRFAFILDKSGSMNSRRWGACRRELGKALAALLPDNEYFLVLFSDRLAEPPGQSGWTGADPTQIAATLKWIEGIRPAGGTSPLPAFERVIALPERADAIFFLTDGEFSDFSPTQCDRLRRTGSASLVKGALRRLFIGTRDDTAAATTINTVALDEEAPLRTLERIAADSGGSCVRATSS